MTLSKSRLRPLTGALAPRKRTAVAQVAELVDALVSGTSGESRGGSSPLLGTIFSFSGKRCTPTTSVLVLSGHSPRWAGAPVRASSPSLAARPGIHRRPPGGRVDRATMRCVKDQLRSPAAGSPMLHPQRGDRLGAFPVARPGKLAAGLDCQGGSPLSFTTNACCSEHCDAVRTYRTDRSACGGPHQGPS